MPFTSFSSFAPRRARPRRTPRITAAVATLGALALGWRPDACQAAGGHHAVDDATILDAGQCQVELWTERQAGDQLQHLGPACHLFGVELGLHLDRNVIAQRSAPGTAGVQVKWAHELQPGLSLGALWAADWQHGATRSATQTLLLPLTWQPHDTLAVHLNVGREFHPQAADVARHGVALEWQPVARWQLLAERWHDATPLRQRVGLRLLASDAVSVDLSRATARGGELPARWALGVNWAFAR